MTTADIDLTFMFLYTRSGEYLSPKSLESLLPITVNPIIALESIVEAGFAKKEINKQATMGGNVNAYSYLINSTGINFINELPVDFKDKPYTYHLKLSEDKTAKEEEIEAINIKKTKIDLANAERVYKTYFSTRLMAIIAAIVSVGLLFLKLAELFGWLPKPK